MPSSPIWILLIINLNGGSPSMIDMSSLEVCEQAAIDASITFATRTACFYAGETQNYTIPPNPER